MGQYANALLEFGVGKFTLLDSSAGMLAVARQKLSKSISNGAVEDLIKAKLPTLPFKDGAFDAVMFNMVLNHLHRDRYDNDFPILEKTLQETKRVLRYKGILVIITPTFAIQKESLWFTQLHPELTEEWIHAVPSTEQYVDLFDKTGFSCVVGVNLLSKAMPSFIKKYFDPDGPFEEEWRIGTCLYGNVKGEELDILLADLKHKAPLKEFLDTHDRTSDFGMFTLFVCVSN